MRDTKRTRRTYAPRAAAETYNELKRRWENDLMNLARAQRIPAALAWGSNDPWHLAFTWFEQDARRDPDGISSGGRKLILDALVKCEALRSDRHEHIFRLQDDYVIDPGTPAKVRVDFLTPLGRGVVTFQIPHRLPDLNELLAARELGARRSLRRAR